MSAHERRDLDREVIREMQRSTEFWIVRARIPERDADEVFWNENHLAWFMSEAEADAYAKRLRDETGSLLGNHNVERRRALRAERKRVEGGGFPDGTIFEVRSVSLPIEMFATAQHAEELCERIGAAWLGRADSIRARIRQANE